MPKKTPAELAKYYKEREAAYENRGTPYFDERLMADTRPSREDNSRREWPASMGLETQDNADSEYARARRERGEGKDIDLDVQVMKGTGHAIVHQNMQALRKAGYSLNEAIRRSTAAFNESLAAEKAKKKK